MAITAKTFKNAGLNYAVLGILTYNQYIFTVMGKLRRELQKHFINLIPDKSINKVFWASATSIIKQWLDAIIIFTIFGIAGGADPLTCIFFTFACASSGTLFVGFTLLFQRLLGEQPNRMTQAFISMGLMLLFIVPSVVVAAVTSYFLPYSMKFLTMLPYAICCLLFFSLILLIGKNILDHMEYSR